MTGVSDSLMHGLPPFQSTPTTQNTARYREKLNLLIVSPFFNTSRVKEAIHLTNRFQVAVRLFSNRSQMTSKCGKNKKVAHEAQLMFLPYFDVLCDLLLNRRTATWNLFVLYNKELKYTEKRF